MTAIARVDSRLSRRIAAIARRATVFGLAMVLLLPAARGHSDWLGWLPLWLVGMPASVWWAAAGMAALAADTPLPMRRPYPRARRRRPQARRVASMRRTPEGLQAA